MYNDVIEFVKKWKSEFGIPTFYSTRRISFFLNRTIVNFD